MHDLFAASELNTDGMRMIIHKLNNLDEKKWM